MIKQNKTTNKETPVVLNFNLHQPLRLSPDRDSFLWNEKNEAAFNKGTNQYYLPALETISEIMLKYPGFKFNFGLSGTFLEQAKEYSPHLMNALKNIIAYGLEHNQIELVGETYYSSLAEFFKDPTEFNKQITKQKDLLKEEFNITPTTYRHTRRPFSTFVGKEIAGQGYKTILTDIISDEYTDTAYTLVDTDNTLVIKRNIELSHLISRQKYLKSEEYIKKLEDSVVPVLLSYAIGRVGDKDFLKFWKEFAKDSQNRLDTTLASSMYSQDDIKKLSQIDIPTEHSISHLKSWQEAKIITNNLIDSYAKFELFKQIEQLFDYPSASLTEKNIRRRSILTSYSNFRFLDGKDDSPDIRSNPYGNPVDATFHFTRKVDKLENKIKLEKKNFQYLKKREQDIILTASPELTQISEEIAPQGAVPINAFGGMAIVASAMANYLAEQGFDSRVLTLDIAQNYDKKAKDLYRQKVAAEMNVKEEKVYLVRSFAFDGIKNPYNNVPQNLLASEAQNHAMKNVFPQLLKEDRSIIHIYHDQIFGGVSAAKFQSISDSLRANGDKRLLKNIQYSHNVHSILLEMESFWDLPDGVKNNYIYYTDGKANSLLTGIKNADRTIFVSEQWLKEVRENIFPDRVPSEFREKIIRQYELGTVTPILNGLPKERYPENASCLKHPSLYFPKADKKTLDLITSFDPESNFLEARLNNKLAIQRLTGLKEDPDAILAVYSGRYDFYQKQCDILEKIIPYLQKELSQKGIRAQFLYLSNPVNDSDVLHSYNNMISYALQSGGNTAIHPFTLPLELLANSGADLAIGASIIEMCGLNDELALICGALPAFTATGGLIDKITPLNLIGYNGYKETSGNGLLFNSDHNSIWYGLKNAFEVANYLRKNPHINQTFTYSRMINARVDLSIETQGEKLVAAIEQTLGRPLN